MKLALKIDVDTLRGTLLGVPQLMDILERFGVRATFLFSVGPDHTGRALRRALRPGFLSKVRRTSVLSHYGLRTCLYGTLLPGPDIGRRGASIMREVERRGHEVGIHAFDHVLWQDQVAHRDERWTLAQMTAAAERFVEIFGRPSQVHAAAGWQMNSSAFFAEEQFGFKYASDTRGPEPFYPRIEGVTVRCPQFPTTLPTLDELIGRSDMHSETPVAHLLRLTAARRHDHVYTLHAELEGGQLSRWFETLLEGWQEQGFDLSTLGRLVASTNVRDIAEREVTYGPMPGRSGFLALASPTEHTAYAS